MGESLNDGCLANARLADQHGIVLCAAGEYADDAADLIVASDDGIELAGLGLSGEVNSIFGKGYRNIKVLVFYYEW